MKEKRDGIARFLEVLCWFFLLVAEFFFLFSFLPWKFFWTFLILTLLILLFALGRRRLSRQKVFLRVSGIILVMLSLSVSWVCFEEASQAVNNLWYTEDLSHYERVRGLPFSTKESRLNFFPYSIPEYASEIKFHSNPHIMQGGSIFSLEFCAPREEVKKWEAVFKEKADYPGSYLAQGLTASDITALIGYPKEFRTYVIYAEDQMGNHNPSLENILTQNHGKIYYGAVNFDANRVYFYKSIW